MIFLSLTLLSIIGYMLYLRYYPVKGVPCIDDDKLEVQQQSVTLDIRDYNTSAKETINNSVFMPVAYLNRFHHEIPSKYIYLIASDKIERNLGIRILKHKGYQVIGYKITNCTCKDRLGNIA